MKILNKFQRRELIKQYEEKLRREADERCENYGHILSEFYVEMMPNRILGLRGGEYKTYDCLVCDHSFSCAIEDELVSPYFSLQPDDEDIMIWA